MNMFAQHRNKLLELFPKEKALIFLKGGDLIFQDDTDLEYEFRQESNFYYLTGITEPGFAAILEVPSGKLSLIFPKRSRFDVVFRGLNEDKKHFAKKYGANNALEKTEVAQFIKNSGARRIHVLKRGHLALRDRAFVVNDQHLVDCLHALRRVKDASELRLIKKANDISSAGHEAVMKATRPGMFEYELRSVFEEVAMQAGLQRQAYNGIYASGKNAATLHYVANNRKIQSGSLVLVDAGAECEEYASDITRTFPANGKFSKQQAEWYDAVLCIQKSMIQKVAPGVSMADLNRETEKMVIEALKGLALVKGALSDLEEYEIGRLFFPHSLGHLLGLDTHDVGARVSTQKKNGIRLGPVLEPGMVLTIEPGLYFIPALLQPALKDKKLSQFLNKEKIHDLFDAGGIRIEDNIVVTQEGRRNLTTAAKERKEIEKLMQ